MKLKDLIASFDQRANGTPHGEFYLTERQSNFARVLADKEQVSLEAVAAEHGVSFRDWSIGKNMRFYGTKHFAQEVTRANASNQRGIDRVIANH